jgi:2-polyprenyl-3-methyl-5-hydroxy-6-metoxy-1,4-benzoquinol methylase
VQYEFNLDRCSACGCVYLIGLYDPDTQQSIDNEFTRLMRQANGYFCRHPTAGIAGEFETEVLHDILREELRFLLSVLKEVGWTENTGRTFLDVGCFKGYSVLAAQRVGFDAEGIEFEPERVRFAREVLGVRIIQTLFEGLIAQGRRYSLITARHVLEHIHDPLPFLEKARALLAPDGFLVILLPNFYSDPLRAMYQEGKISGDLTIHHVNYFNVSQTVDLVRRAGWRVRFSGTAGAAYNRKTRITLHRRYGVGPGHLGWYGPAQGKGPLRYRCKQLLKRVIFHSRHRKEVDFLSRKGAAGVPVPPVSDAYGDGDRGVEICVIAAPS